MSIEKKIRIKLTVGMIALMLCMFSSGFARTPIGEFPMWVITWVLSMIAYGTLLEPINGILRAAKECELEKKDE